MSKKVDPQKKYWWLLAVVVPIIIAMIGIVPNLIDSRKSDPSPLPTGISITNNNFGNNMYFVTQVMGAEDPAKAQAAQQAIQSVTSLVQNSDYANAISQLEQAATQYQFPSIYNNLGVLYANMGEYDKAREAYNSALKLDPNDQAANFNLGLLEQFQGNTDAAQTAFSKAPDLNTTPPSSPAQVPTGSGVTVTTQVPGITAQLIDFSRFQNTITLKMRLINSNTTDTNWSYDEFFYAGHVLDEATGNTYRISDQSNGGAFGLITANSSLDIWVKYSVPAEDSPQYLTAVFGYGVIFERLPVR